METVTLPKIKYDIVEKKAFLYEKIFKSLPKRLFGVESYSSEQIKEFIKEDRIDKKTKNSLNKILKSL